MTPPCLWNPSQCGCALITARVLSHLVNECQAVRANARGVEQPLDVRPPPQVGAQAVDDRDEHRGGRRESRGDDISSRHVSSAGLVC